MEDKALQLSDNEAVSFIGGAGTITATLISAVTGLIKAFYGIGQDLGSALKRAIKKQSC